ncbi:NAD-dependent epimerase/dehydratase family protein [Agrococcus jenensis]|uniref:NAD-dependent epimerase/dehydratase family protein n=1 Tax=Agrococcus jenensis TaxID=46353 RepID=A0A3N2AQJ6_9MICO|nr:NAD(P)-dependent oxidoreductase [Agrococcus jenensis]ROR65185.1 NAD-dependent epimerase/dehydratase family protein [Agrococcus jenensis]
MSRVVMITGGAGTIGQVLLDRPEREGWRAVVLDPLPLPEAFASRADVEQVLGSLTDRDAVEHAMRDATDVVHLGAVSTEDEWERILDVNVTGTRTVLDAASERGVGRFVYASSNHAVGWYTPRDAGGLLADDAPPRPDTYYGWSKAAGEALVRLYCERGRMRGVALRIGHCFPEPRTGSRLPVWLSPVDTRALVQASLEHDIEPFQVVWGVSANTRSWCSREGGRRIGFTAVDDSERYADRFPESPGVDPDEPLGAHFVSMPLGEASAVR